MKILITTDEIKHLKTSPRHLSWEDISPITGVMDPPIQSVKLKSGYIVSYTIDSIFKEKNVKIEHVIIMAYGFEPDPADADKIAHTLLGKCVRAPPSWSQQGRMHYIKLIGLASEELNQFYEDGIEQGVNVVEVGK